MACLLDAAKKSPRGGSDDADVSVPGTPRKRARGPIGPSAPFLALDLSPAVAAAAIGLGDPFESLPSFPAAPSVPAPLPSVLPDDSDVDLSFIDELFTSSASAFSTPFPIGPDGVPDPCIASGAPTAEFPSDFTQP